MHEALANGALVDRQPLRPHGPSGRRLLVTPEVNALMAGGMPRSGFPNVEAEVVVGRFIAGWAMSISVAGRGRVDGDLKRLTGVDEVWAMSFRKPRPGWRLLGRFAKRNVFVGLAAFDRHDLAGRATYTSKAEAVIAAWDRLLERAEPLRASKAEEYIDGPILGLDA